jgi:hypothetical protein
MKGCCLCDPGWVGRSCAISTITGSSQSSQTIVPTTQSSSTSLTATITEGEYPYNVSLSSSAKMYWKIDNGKSEIEIAISANTNGWVRVLRFDLKIKVGLGISSNGRMVGADIIMGWVDTSGPHAVDFYLTSQEPCGSTPGACRDTEYSGGVDNVLVYNGTRIW